MVIIKVKEIECPKVQQLHYTFVINRSVIFLFFCYSDYLDAKRYKKPYIKKFMLMLHKNIAQSRKRMNIFKVVKCKFKVCLTFWCRSILSQLSCKAGFFRNI